MNIPQTIVYWIGLLVLSFWVCGIALVLFAVLVGWILNWRVWRRDLWR